MKTLLHPDGRWLAPWDHTAASPGAVVTGTSQPGQPAPVLVQLDYNERLPGAGAIAQARARLLVAAIESRYAGAAGPAGLVAQRVVRGRGRSRLEVPGARPKELQR